MDCFLLLIDNRFSIVYRPVNRCFDVFICIDQLTDVLINRASPITMHRHQSNLQYLYDFLLSECHRIDVETNICLIFMQNFLFYTENVFLKCSHYFTTHLIL